MRPICHFVEFFLLLSERAGIHTVDSAQAALPTIS